MFPIIIGCIGAVMSCVAHNWSAAIWASAYAVQAFAVHRMKA